MNSRSGWEIVLVLMVMGNIPIIYQKEVVDVSKKCIEMKKNGPGNISYRQWVGFLG